ncbi:uncharacterized protein TNCV_2302971 [Trichonephila clavipes]|nr:uncharacterized protein TNCV_2302971 [Trichonephila clavipes]
MASIRENGVDSLFWFSTRETKSLSLSLYKWMFVEVKSLHFNTVQLITMKIGMYMYSLCGEGFCAILFVAAPHQEALQHRNLSIVPSIAKLPTESPKMIPIWLYRQQFAMFPLNRHYNVRNGIACESYNFNIK